MHRILDGVKLFSYVPNIGDARSLIVDPANITHREVPESYRKAAGVSDDLIRLSIGLEDAGDLMADLDRAIAGAYGSRRGHAAVPYGETKKGHTANNS